MKLFARLIHTLETSNKTNDKIQALSNYLADAPSNDKIWMLALFTGKRPKRPVKTNLMRQWALEATGLPEWLFLECYSNVGDLGETLALILPEPEGIIDKPLHQWMAELRQLREADEAQQKSYVLQSWMGLDTRQRLIFNKLIGGGFRLGVSYKLLVTALAQSTGIDLNQLTHSLMGKWDPAGVDYDDLISGILKEENLAAPYPFCLAYPIEKEVEELGSPEDWLAEYKWDGIRGQLIRRKGEVFIWSRGEELVTAQFPELKDAAAALPDGIVLDGEILAVRDRQVLDFSKLQQRLNRKTISRKMLDEIPVRFYTYDILEYQFQDLREEPMAARRAMLESLTLPDSIDISPIIKCNNWPELRQLRERARELNSEGLMLKAADSIYHNGRKKGDWWKWKLDPYTIDAVLIYAQKGSGRRSRFYTDYTFAVRDGDQLVTIAKAYSGLTDKEITEVSRFVNQHAIEKFGPVRTVKPELVFELGFEGISRSSRHKAGVAVRFPRILRWRRDKSVADINTLADLKSMLRE